jgi:hypothetical protein
MNGSFPGMNKRKMHSGEDKEKARTVILPDLFFEQDNP